MYRVEGKIHITVLIIRRSAILFLPNDKANIWIRLKGCGDIYRGFPIQAVADHPELVEIRGCMFEHTASRELAMTQLINDILVKNNLAVANVPLGKKPLL